MDRKTCHKYGQTLHIVTILVKNGYLRMELLPEKNLTVCAPETCRDTVS